MLKASKRITIESKCVVDGAEIAGFRALLDSETGEISFHPYQIDKAACKEHRVELRKDQAEFEDYCYSLQDKI